MLQNTTILWRYNDRYLCDDLLGQVLMWIIKLWKFKIHEFKFHDPKKMCVL
nr:hypothetical protein [Mucilaginibacter sp. SP1R1]